MWARSIGESLAPLQVRDSRRVGRRRAAPRRAAWARGPRMVAGGAMP